MSISEQLASGQLRSMSEWVSFDPAGKILNEAVRKGLLGPLDLLVETTPGAIENLLAAIDTANEVLTMIEEAMTGYVDPALVLAKTTIQTVLDILNKAVDMFMGIAVGGEVKLTAFTAQKNDYGIPTARGFSPRFEEAVNSWQNKPSGDRVWGFVFFPLYLPAFDVDALMDTIEDTLAMVTDDINDINDMFLKHKKSISDNWKALDEALTNTDRSRLRNEQKRLDAINSDIIQDMVDTYIDVVRGGDSSASSVGLIADAEEDLAEAVLLSYNTRAEINQGLDGTVVDNVMVNALKKQAAYNPETNTLDITLVLPDNTNVTVTAVTLVGVSKYNPDDTNTVVVYRNMKHDLLSIIPPVDLMVETVTGMSTDDALLYITMLRERVGFIDDAWNISQDVISEYGEALMHILALVEFVQSDAWQGVMDAGGKQDDVGSSYYTRSLSVDYSDLQATRSRGLIGGTTYTPAKFSVQLSDSDVEELELGLYDYSVAVNVVHSQEYALPTSVIMETEPITVDVIEELVDDYLNRYIGKYPISYTRLSKYYAIPVDGYNAAAEDAASFWKDDHSAKRWVGGSLATVTMEQLLGKNKNVVKTIYEIVDDINAVGEFAIATIDDAMDMSKDVVKVTDMVRDLINRILKDYLLELLNRIKDALDLPGMGFVAGLINGEPTEVTGLVERTFSEKGMSRYVYGGTILIGGSDLLKTMLDILSAVNGMENSAKNILAVAEATSAQFGSTSEELEDIAEEIAAIYTGESTNAGADNVTITTSAGISVGGLPEGDIPDYKALAAALETLTVRETSREVINIDGIDPATVLQK